MKKLILCLTTIGIILLAACSKDEQEISLQDNSFETDLEIKNYLIDHFQFLEQTIEETNEGFLVEGDVFFPKKDFWEKYKQPSNTSAKHYKSKYKVSLETVDIIFDGSVPRRWRTAFRSAIAEWNNLNGGIKFHLITGTYCPANGITVDFASLGSSNNDVFARGGFPTSNGNPGSLITVNSTCTVSQNAAQRLKTAVHELGHTIGFMHTDISSGYAQITWSNTDCSTEPDPASIMRQGLISFVDFSTCDKQAFKKLYPK